MKRILTIAGSDSGGGAGIQTDLKTITVLGAYGMSAITALTAQNTLGVQGIQPVPVDFIRLQIRSVVEDLGVDGVKTGMLGTPEVVAAVAEELGRVDISCLVVDPVMVAKSGDALLSKDARGALKDMLLPLATLVTPNLPEASVICGFEVTGLTGMERAARAIYAMGPRYVLVKGGHLEGEALDLLYDGESFQTFSSPRLQSRNTHGTGCTYAAALTTLLAQGFEVKEAVARAKAFITRAIACGVSLGKGHGPTNPYAHVLRYVERDQTWNALAAALDRLLQAPLGRLIPEVRSNLAYALPGATGYEEVAGIPGRITQIGDRIVACSAPAFGATRHMARVILAAMAHDPGMRAAMNIRYSPRMLEACIKAGLRVASFDRRQEPGEVKEKEGSTLEWGTAQALKGLDHTPDAIYDEGDVGKEPMIRILDRDPAAVVEKVLSIGKALDLVQIN